MHKNYFESFKYLILIFIETSNIFAFVNFIKGMIQFPVFQSDQKITNLYLTEKIIIFGTPIEFIFGILLYLIEQII